MPFKFIRKATQHAHWIRVPALRSGELNVQLPSILDGMNCRLVRKLVLTRIGECSSLRFCAAELQRLGGVGAATLLQIMRVAEHNGVTVTVINVAEPIREKLFVMLAAERRRQSQVGEIRDSLATIVLSDANDDGRSTLHLPAVGNSGRHKAA